MCATLAFNYGQIGQSVIQPTSSVRNLGVQLRSNLAINDQVSAVVRSCNYNIRQLRAVRSTLSRDALRDTAYALVLSRLHFCNSLYANALLTQMRLLLMIINMTAGAVSGCRRFDPFTDFIKRELHRLPAIERVQFKICTMAFKAVHNHLPSYNSELIISSSTIARSHDLRSSSQQVLLVPRHRTHFSERAFAVAGPTMWNVLTVEVHNAPTLITFRPDLRNICSELHMNNDVKHHRAGLPHRALYKYAIY